MLETFLLLHFSISFFQPVQQNLRGLDLAPLLDMELETRFIHRFPSCYLIHPLLLDFLNRPVGRIKTQRLINFYYSVGLSLGYLTYLN